MTQPLDDFLGNVFLRLRVARTALHTFTLYLNPYLVNYVPRVEARAGILGCSTEVLACIHGEKSHTPLAREAYAQKLAKIVERLTKIEKQTQAQRREEFWTYARYPSGQAAAAIDTDDPLVWTELASAFRSLWNAWTEALAPMPYLADVWAYFAREDPDAFWGAYWDWMLSPPRSHASASVMASVDTYIAQLPLTVAALRGDASKAACQRALETEMDALYDADDWSVLMTDRARTALIATGTIVDPPPHVMESWHADAK